MTIRPVVLMNHPILRRKAHKVRPADIPALGELIDDMIETMRAEPGVGLAAPQVGVSLRLAVIEYAPPLPEDAPPGTPPPRPRRYVIINPEIVSRSSEMVTDIEGCLSVPGYVGRVTRHAAVTVMALNRQGRPQKIKAQGWLARIFQHEIDHLNGVLFVDRATEIWETPKKEAQTPQQKEVVQPMG